MTEPDHSTGLPADIRPDTELGEWARHGRIDNRPDGSTAYYDPTDTRRIVIDRYASIESYVVRLERKPTHDPDAGWWIVVGTTITDQLPIAMNRAHELAEYAELYDKLQPEDGGGYEKMPREIGWSLDHETPVECRECGNIWHVTHVPDPNADKCPACGERGTWTAVNDEDRVTLGLDDPEPRETPIQDAAAHADPGLTISPIGIAVGLMVSIAVAILVFGLIYGWWA